MVNGFPRYCDFMDPQDPARGVFRIQTSRYQFNPVYRPHITLENFTELFAIPEFQAALWNTARIALLGISASVISSVLIAYGFSRFPVPFGRVLFILLIGSIMLPDKVTLVPNIAMFFLYLNWDGTYLPLIVPYLFGNAVMIFLLHQNFRRIPKEQEEAAMLDGAGVTRILWDIILPQSVPVIATVILLQFFFFWNDLGGPTLYLSLAPDLQPVSFWLQQDLAFGAHPPNALQARALVSMIVPAAALILSQRFFMQGIRITGVEK
jgi:multiple sugar transport system permease protein